MRWDEREYIYKEALKKWGKDAQVMMAVEEMGELLQALSKHDRTKGYSSIDELAEEIADVTIMMEQLCVIFHIKDLVDEIKEQKLYRLDDLVNED